MFSLLPLRLFLAGSLTVGSQLYARACLCRGCCFTFPLPPYAFDRLTLAHPTNAPATCVGSLNSSNSRRTSNTRSSNRWQRRSQRKNRRRRLLKPISRGNRRLRWPQTRLWKSYCCRSLDHSGKSNLPSRRKSKCPAVAKDAAFCGKR